MASRDDFTDYQKETLAKKTNYRCCRCGNDARDDGQAAHVSAASEGGPRYQSGMTTEERKSLSNGIWLCSRCHKKVDSDPISFNADYLRHLKGKHEKR